MGAVVVTMPDELDHTNAAHVNQQLAAAFARGAGVVIADFTPTVFCDSSGIREIVLARQRAAAAGAVLRVVIRLAGGCGPIWPAPGPPDTWRSTPSVAQVLTTGQQTHRRQPGP